VNTAIQVAHGLQHAHENDVVHRDIKSDNIMISDGGEAIILDFGLAKLADHTRVTQAGTTVGTLAYMSPEQARGEVVDRRTDMWSLGVVLYEMICGQLPFTAQFNEAVVYSIINQEPKPLTGLRTGVPLLLEQVVTKMMAKNPDERYQHMDELIVDLRRVGRELDPSSVSATAPVAAKAESMSLMRHLFERRVPQIIGVYVLASIGIVALVAWLVNRYPLSPNLPDFSLVALISMVPTVVLLAYFHGKSGTAGWSKIERVGIPANVVATAALLFIVFQGRDLGAATTTVSLEDDEGNTIERVIPKAEFRKRVAIFYFENESPDSTDNWLQYGLPTLLEHDLSQDIYLTTRRGFSGRMKEAGFDKAVGAPLTLKKKIARDNHFGSFLAGSLTKNEETIVVSTVLYESKRGKVVARDSFSGTDVFQLVDSLSVRLKQALEIPAYHMERTEDLPVSEITTSSLSAFKSYMAAGYAKRYNNDHEKAAAHLNDAVEEDPSFTYAYWELYRTHSRRSEPALAKQAMQAALRHKYKLPEPDQFWLMSNHYDLEQKHDERFENAKRWVELYPQATDGYYALASIYQQRNELDAAIEQRERILELDPSRHRELQTIGWLYSKKGEFDTTLEYYNRYAERFPDKYESYTTLADLHKTMGDYDGARANYKKALHIEPDKIWVLTELAGVELYTGNFDDALDQYQRAQDIATTPEDRGNASMSLVDYYSFRGQIEKAIETFQSGMSQLSQCTAPAQLDLLRFLSADLYCMSGREETALKMIKDFEAQQHMPPLDRLAAIGYLMYYLELRDATYLPEAQKALEEFGQFISDTGFEVIRYVYLGFEGALLMMSGDYTQATASLKKAIDSAPAGDDDPEFNVYLSECYRELGELEQAVEIIEEALKIEPFNAETHVEVARVYHAMGNVGKAYEHLDTALMVWAQADAEFEPATDARVTLAEWESSTPRVQ
jgi:tetratricopeptide (TPR) repeat protein